MPQPQVRWVVRSSPASLPEFTTHDVAVQSKFSQPRTALPNFESLFDNRLLSNGAQNAKNELGRVLTASSVVSYALPLRALGQDYACTPAPPALSTSPAEFAAHGTWHLQGGALSDAWFGRLPPLPLDQSINQSTAAVAGSSKYQSAHFPKAHLLALQHTTLNMRQHAQGVCGCTSCPQSSALNSMVLPMSRHETSGSRSAATNWVWSVTTLCSRAGSIAMHSSEGCG